MGIIISYRRYKAPTGVVSAVPASRVEISSVSKPEWQGGTLRQARHRIKRLVALAHPALSIREDSFSLLLKLFL